ncbi:16S rRNA (cytosine1402-N4)-methyltransferase [Novimethylophilus kurashikiensis]|uniref:Ribosomal RNA small subunit methyltransferase H n=1 Tax=Novimethylophilus kurashikiensis TaxID=1825523 RepID=A0A2R5FAX3_9PROT|nr:16S rRNA (cytosine(1402)-N(4))-methyltransferase RsmH [Novimethylophilus kurashikiensis]GBG15357.1 16S rRNA (cytosine1402-N4)-methyltransferase [Novimethylophilus kurashikiensis]
MSLGSQHIPVLLEETVAALDIKPDGVYVDGTFGRGGHSRAILERLGPQGRLIALDRDAAAIAAANAIGDPRFTAVRSAFSQIGEAVRGLGINQIDGALLDIGVSSPQIDEADRGFSFRFDGPLDMRMDQSRGQTAAEFLATASEQQIREVIKEYGEERFAKQIARTIVAARTGGQPLGTTRQLAALVAGAIPKAEPGQDPATRTFQALRIFLNQELEELSLALPQCADLLAPGGRLAVISFHSLEDRIVKRFIRSQQDRDNLPSNFPVRAADLPPPRLVAVGKAVHASDEELSVNPRARSAVLRVAERTAAA